MSNRNTIRSRLVEPEPGQDPELLARVCYDVLRGIKEHFEVKRLLVDEWHNLTTLTPLLR